MELTILTSIITGGIGVFAGWCISRRFGRMVNIKPRLTNSQLISGKMKLVLIVRTDLKMGCGKIAAQCSHATLSCYEKLIDTNPDILETWEHQGQPKIVLRVGSYDEMLKLSDKAKSLGLVNSIIHDAGHTQVAEGTATVLGIGPGLASEIDRVSGDLRLFP
ncbi:Peptidyl-tRNA hydrolase 2 isoform 2 [Schistosoma japonicum]|uniref:peptidyl-tRNA hydrolase n=2 Tax=Schistosoma japonicum TaxID=6182 RepID=Q5DB59_SCHJA|nr:SJCHGC05407 protein [Schistosoma japonicum]KAH8848588.1 Peptidyl-tRNA hydrolase 2, mitochondrial [Schistosoma japonicum]TNN18817.1 Peptidyl-tRNA hydrolase 2 isoform 2 [Schistosoma japonicum]TNN18818.1 Peptidyl-tRNA hydrolase 2 isoform 2 [Schistosoma japonicum]TNN18819.1 Peptidyl-tRNA hydrolase 2 isoform 2 [Schistosoma japonicum]